MSADPVDPKTESLDPSSSESGSSSAASNESQTSPGPSAAAAPIARKVLNLRPSPMNLSTPGLVPRPIDPSPVHVSHTVSIAGTRPVMRNPRHVMDSIDFVHAPRILNRPIAPNVTEESNQLLEYLD